MVTIGLGNMYMTASVQPLRGVSVGMTMPLCEQQEEPIPTYHSFTLCTVLWCIFIQIHDNQLIMPSLAIIKTILKQTKTKSINMKWRTQTTKKTTLLIASSQKGSCKYETNIRTIYKMAAHGANDVLINSC